MVNGQLVILLAPISRLRSYYHLLQLEVCDKCLHGVALTPSTFDRPDAARTQLTL